MVPWLKSAVSGARAIKKAIEDEAKSKNISVEKASKEAQDIMDEIAANFSYSLIKRAAGAFPSPPVQGPDGSFCYRS